MFWWQNGEWQETTVDFWILVELDGEDRHGWDDVFLFVVDGPGFENGSLARGAWSDKNHAMVFDGFDRAVGVDVSEVLFKVVNYPIIW